MISPDQLAALEAAAESWRKTPFCEGTPVKGAGVSCHHLVAEVFFESGILQRVPIPNGPAHWSAANSRSLIREWVEQSGLFFGIMAATGSLARIARPGDLLGFRVCNEIHHAAIQLGAGRIVHSVIGHGVQIPPCIPSEWERRLEAVWRPKPIA